MTLAERIKLFLCNLSDSEFEVMNLTYGIPKNSEPAGDVVASLTLSRKPAYSVSGFVLATVSLPQDRWIQMFREEENRDFHKVCTCDSMIWTQLPPDAEFQFQEPSGFYWNCSHCHTTLFHPVQL